MSKVILRCILLVCFHQLEIVSPEKLAVPVPPPRPKPSNFDSLPPGNCVWVQLGTDPNADDTCTDDASSRVLIGTQPSTGSREIQCCVPNSQAEYNAKYGSDPCTMSGCNSSPDPCSTFDRSVYWDGSIWEYEQLVRDTCVDGATHGFISACCERNSTKSLLFSLAGANNNEFPHHAQILEGCGASIYDKRHLITAGHCCNKEAADLHVLLGSNVYNKDFAGDRLYGVEDRTRKDAVDICVVRLDRDIVFGPNIKAIKMAPKNFKPWDHADYAVLNGMGSDDTGSGTIQYQKSNMALVSQEDCTQDETILCAGGYHDGKLTPTVGSGDSGGPLICRDESGQIVLCGVASHVWALTPCDVNNVTGDSCKPSWFASVPNAFDWIREITKVDQDESTLYRPYLYGEGVPPGKYEHQVHITANGKSCGGTLIDVDIVVTAANCVSGIDAKSIKVVSQMTNFNSRDGKVHSVKWVKVLDGFNRVGDPVDVKKQGIRVIISDNFHSNDLAVIKLNEGSGVDPAKLAKLASSSDKFETATEVTWVRSNIRHGQLISRNYNFMDKKLCQRHWNRLKDLGHNIPLDENILCGVETYSGGSLCDRELGGGLICKGANGDDALCGVQVFRLCEFALPNAFLNVATVKSWIESAKTSL